MKRKKKPDLFIKKKRRSVFPFAKSSDKIYYIYFPGTGNFYFWYDKLKD